MKVKKYTGEKIQDVIFQVKADLGPEAVIINKRKFKKGGIFGFFGKTMFEVVAALEGKTKNNEIYTEDQDDDRVVISTYGRGGRKFDNNDKEINKTASPDPENKNAIKEFISGLKSEAKNEDLDSKKVKELSDVFNEKTAAKKNENDFKIDLNKSHSKEQSDDFQLEKNQNLKNDQNLEKEKKYKQRDKNLTAEQKLKNKFQSKKAGKGRKNLINNNQLYNYLLDQGVDSRNLNIFLKKINEKIDSTEETEFKEDLKKFFELYFSKNGEIILDSKQKIVTFIGPTGVGKTTTMAKIAAHFSVEANKRVGLITADTYRIAAVEQLQTYSDIIDIPFAVCYSGSKLNDMLKGKFRDCDLILIDTPGSSWKDEDQLGRLNDYTDKNLIDEVHLLLSLNTKSSDLRSIISKFEILEPDKVLLTKLDETNSYGDIINIKEKYNLPFSYLTAGQDVPEDFEVADPEIIYRYLFGDFYA
jgi:flagellar biosynthesis protein FlhF